jgi:hypothetical protein
MPKTPLYPHVTNGRRNISEALGMKVHLKLRNGEEGFARNVREIRYGYGKNDSSWLRLYSGRYSLVMAYHINNIIEFEITPETEIARDWWEPMPGR